MILMLISFFFQLYVDHRDLHVLTHAFPTRRSSDLRSSLSLRVRSAFFCCVSSAASRSSSTVCVPVRRSAFFSLLLSWLARLIFFLSTRPAFKSCSCNETICAAP